MQEYERERLEYIINKEDELNQKQIPYDKLLMGLPHSQRTIINDFSNSNKFPSSNSRILSQTSSKK